MRIAEMTKADLQSLRAERIEALANATTLGQRVEVQADLSNVNARLKQINIAEAQVAKAIADQRKAEGNAEQRDNLRRAHAKSTPATTAAIVAAIETPSVSDRPLHAKPSEGRSLTRGEFLLKHAKQMVRTIDTIKPARRLSHTIVFRRALDEFIREQKQHLAAFDAHQERQRVQETSGESVATTQEAWKQTWAANTATEPPTS